MKKPLRKPPKRTKVAAVPPAEDSLSDRTRERAVSLGKTFRTALALFTDGPIDLVPVFGYWVGYPLFLELIGFGGGWAKSPETVQAYYALNSTHTAATHILMSEAAKRGLDPHPLYECGRVVQEIYLADPELCVKRTGATSGTWPECMGAARYSLPAVQQEALRAGEAVFIRLATAVNVAQAAPALTPEDRAILDALAEANTTMQQADIAAAAERDVKTIRERLKRLAAAGLVSRPCGERSGFSVTAAGLGVLNGTPA